MAFAFPAGALPFVAKTDLSSSTIIWQTFFDEKWTAKYPLFNKTRTTDVGCCEGERLLFMLVATW